MRSPNGCISTAHAATDRVSRSISHHYLKSSPNGFQVYETYRTVNGIKQYQLRIVMVLVFTDEKNRVLEETLETTVFLRNSQ